MQIYRNLRKQKRSLLIYIYPIQQEGDSQDHYRGK